MVQTMRKGQKEWRTRKIGKKRGSPWRIGL
jgi:hypothetical protein